MKLHLVVIVRVKLMNVLDFTELFHRDYNSPHSSEAT